MSKANPSNKIHHSMATTNAICPTCEAKAFVADALANATRAVAALGFLDEAINEIAETSSHTGTRPNDAQLRK
ncbi:hypothetical protein [Anaeromyxobacter soli]|uniref:hypothetical protein n=1 Tax=Anaeromyxobacter soli TaxID=2922725 RepID=UPI001FAED4FC|nr:hypothetical protein [Anaeromyxobacter sp. SG29]